MLRGAWRCKIKRNKARWDSLIACYVSFDVTFFKDVWMILLDLVVDITFIKHHRYHGVVIMTCECCNFRSLSLDSYIFIQIRFLSVSRALAKNFNRNITNCYRLRKYTLLESRRKSFWILMQRKEDTNATIETTFRHPQAKLHGNLSVPSGLGSVTVFHRLLSGSGHITRHCFDCPRIPRDPAGSTSAMGTMWLPPELFSLIASFRLGSLDTTLRSFFSSCLVPDPAVKELHRYLLWELLHSSWSLLFSKYTHYFSNTNIVQIFYIR